MKKSIALFTICLAFSLFVIGEEKESPARWEMYKGNPMNTGFTTTKALRTAPVVKWKFDTCSKRYLNSVIYADKLLVPANIGHLYRYDLETGKDLLLDPIKPGNPLSLVPYEIGDYFYASFQDWRFKQNKIIRFNMRTMNLELEHTLTEEYLSPVAANENYLYLAKNDGTVDAIDIATKEKRWSFKAEAGVSTRPTPYKDYVFIATQQGHLYALDAIDGSLRWQFKEGAGILTPPLVANDFLITVSLDGKVYLHEIKTGNLKWDLYTESGIVFSPTVVDETIYIGSSAGQINAITFNNLHLWNYKEIAGVGSPMTADKERVYFANQAGNIIALSRDKGEFIWKTPLENLVSSPLLLHESKLYFSAADYYYCLDAKTGGIRWFRKLPCDITSSPIMDDTNIYFGTFDGRFYAFNYKLGKYEWYHTSYGFIRGSGIILGDKIGYEAADNKFRIIDNKGKTELFTYNVMASDNFSPTASGNILLLDGLGYLVAYDWKEYKELWRTEVIDIQKWKVYTTPAIAEDLLVYGSNDQNFYARSLKDGKLKWTFPTEGLIRAAPSISNSIVFCASSDKNLYAVKLKDGKLKWKFTAEGFFMASPSIAYNTIYVGSFDTYFYAIDEKKGTLKWKFQSDGEITAPATIADNTVYFGNKKGTLYALDTQTGKELWHFNTPHPIVTAPIVKDSEVYFTSCDGYIYALKASQ
ncbi:MAG: hypothetical protein A2Y62_10490 [Candidatus Fischerbacteria bacterium RBG_13_37_8]|uniref:Pyrrolo-quinoline quinone repeat domain-containing protein n=1 Tax=Candidatus Fischerbacteria bacterium RBG_13_37_8 TaxID=1817863 RepID=A0A1F5VNV5_9BACT|nr:MAG: hypothetical protein A2Y62_10490 [Candidatus Fischerbacteria bacterium RBG_13_37_8]